MTMIGTIGDVTMADDGNLKMVTPTGMVTIASGGSITAPITSSTTLTLTDPTEDLMEKWIMNRVTIDHKVQEHELLKLKEVAPDYANEIKENLTKTATRDMEIEIMVKPTSLLPLRDALRGSMPCST